MVVDLLKDQTCQLHEFAGHPAAIAMIRSTMDRARARRRCLPSLLLRGPEGTGKHTLAVATAQAWGTIAVFATAPLSRGELAGLLTGVEDGGIVVLEEIHRQAPDVVDVLVEAATDFRFDIHIGEGAAARTIPLGLPLFTLIGTSSGLGVDPRLEALFEVQIDLNYCDHDGLRSLVLRRATTARLAVTDDEAAEIARRSRGQVRWALHLLARLGDYTDAFGSHPPIAAIADEVGLDALGLAREERQLLRALCQTYRGGPVGLGTLARAVGARPEAIEDKLEPYLIRAGLLEVTPQGRRASDAAFTHLGLVRQ